MSKIFFTNSLDYFQKNKAISTSNGFTRYTDFVSFNENIIAYKKLKVDNENFLKSGNDYIASAGTLIYKYKSNSEALKQIFYDFNDNVDEIRDNLIGNYLLVLKKGNVAYIFCDENNIFDTYYFNENDTWVISNNLYDISVVCDNQINVNKINLLVEVFQHTLLQNDTIYDEIKKLYGNQYIKINFSNNCFDLLNFKKKLNKVYLKSKTVEFNVKELSDLIENYVGIINSNFKNSAISMTGGLDSRTILAAFLKTNNYPSLIYGVGNSGLTNTKKEDLEINYIYEKFFNLKLYILDWSTSNKPNCLLNLHTSKYGYYSLLYGSSQQFISSFENLEGIDFIDFGYFGEPLRNVSWIENMQKEYFTLNEFIDFFYLNFHVKSFLDKKEFELFYSKIYNDYLNICIFNNLNHYKISKNDFQILHNEYRKGADTALVNFVNYNYYSINILSLVEIEKFISSIPCQLKYKSFFMLKLINNLYSSILDVPCFSHTENYFINKDTFMLSSVKKNSFKKNIIKIFKLNKSNNLLVKFIKYFYYILKKSEYPITNKQLKKYFFNDEDFVNSKYKTFINFNGDIRFVAKFVQMIKILKTKKI